MANDHHPAHRVQAGLWKGAAVLGGAAVVSKLLGTLQKIPLQNLAGDAAFGIYNIVYPIYILILTLATAGFPIVVSAFVAERLKDGRPGDARRVLAVAAGVLAVSSLLFFVLLYGGADLLAGWLDSPKTAPAIRSVAYALLLVPLLAVLRGYFQGRGDMVPTAVSQVAEQLVRVAVMLTLLLYYVRLGAGADRIAAGAMTGSAAGAAAGFLVMAVYWRRRTRAAQGCPARPAPTEPLGPLAWRFLKAAVPVALGSLVLPLLTMADSLTLPGLLRAQGWDEAGRLYAIGLYNHGQPLVQLVALVATSLSAALVPAMAEAKMLGAEEVRRRAYAILHFTWVVGGAAAVGLVSLAIPLNVMFYESPEGSTAMALIGSSALFSAVNLVTGSLLVGLGALRAPAVHLFAAVGLKLALNAALVPLWGINGAALSTVAAYALAAGLNLWALQRRTSLVLPAGAFLGRPLAALAVMAAALLLLQLIFGEFPASGIAEDARLAQTALALGGVGGGAAVYAVCLFRFRVITRSRLAELPKGGDKLVSLAERLRLLPKT
ncbi:polysaccharide biosynthesis protein [Paenibacillus aurantius]|uniref:Polysaccharide biosynthesis protein n=1 Tax=Paenibacillus aurantius TaxID=2918900 RepID=A0AA96LCY0_9BACL|nr:polysaccharide biosynthesis protein [Paenibacillus aurantius]WNQ11679.1 polysaccharide biosynthesis protein [Paenibacillus aurantius]